MQKLVHINPVGGDLYVVREFVPPAGHPDQGLPTIPGVPDNSLPTTPPPTPPTGMVVVIVRTADGKWHWAYMPSANVPTPLPEPPPTAAPKA
jgi:hypothetical protein